MSSFGSRTPPIGGTDQTLCESAPRLNTIASLLGDQRGRDAGTSPEVIAMGCPPCRFCTQTCGTPLASSLMNVIQLPSGEKLAPGYKPESVRIARWVDGSDFRQGSNRIAAASIPSSPRTVATVQNRTRGCLFLTGAANVIGSCVAFGSST